MDGHTSSYDAGGAKLHQGQHEVHGRGCSGETSLVLPQLSHASRGVLDNGRCRTSMSLARGNALVYVFISGSYWEFYLRGSDLCGVVCEQFRVA